MYNWIKDFICVIILFELECLAYESAFPKKYSKMTASWYDAKFRADITFSSPTFNACCVSMNIFGYI